MTLRPEQELRRYGDLMVFAAVLFVIGLLMGVGIGYGVAQTNKSVAVQMYVMEVGEGADVERYAVEQAGDQFTYQMPEHILNNIQQTPFFAHCVDGLSITSIWTEYAEQATCNDEPVIRVVLIAPY